MASQLQKLLRAVFKRIGTSTITSPLELSESRSDRLLKNHADINDSLTSDIQLPSASVNMESSQLSTQAATTQNINQTSHQIAPAEALSAGEGDFNLQSADISGYEDFDKVRASSGVVYIAQYFARLPDDLRANDYTYLN